jgi:hypothetical protein
LAVLAVIPRQGLAHRQFRQFAGQLAEQRVGVDFRRNDLGFRLVAGPEALAEP